MEWFKSLVEFIFMIFIIVDIIALLTDKKK